MIFPEIALFITLLLLLVEVNLYQFSVAVQLVMEVLVALRMLSVEVLFSVARAPCMVMKKKLSILRQNLK
jgi:hypothetical protein